MYKDFYRFLEEPFSLTPNPKFLYLAPSHADALSSMMHGIQERKGVTVVTGEVGTGKTLLVYALLKDLNPKIHTAFIFHTPLSFEDLLKNVLRELKVPWRTEEDNVFSLLELFRTYLHERLARNETVAIVIDEAQALSEGVLEHLFRLRERDPAVAELLQILLVGHPELNSKLNSQKLRLLKANIDVRCQIRPLAREEGMGYLKHRLKLVGRNISDVLAPEAADLIWKFSEGIPRIMNVVCDQAFRMGEISSSPKIDSKIVREAVRRMAHLRPSRAKSDLGAKGQKNMTTGVLKLSFFLFAVCVFLLSAIKILSFLLRT